MEKTGQADARLAIPTLAINDHGPLEGDTHGLGFDPAPVLFEGKALGARDMSPAEVSPGPAVQEGRAAFREEVLRLADRDEAEARILDGGRETRPAAAARSTMRAAPLKIARRSARTPFLHQPWVSWYFLSPALKTRMASRRSRSLRT